MAKDETLKITGNPHEPESDWYKHETKRMGKIKRTLWRIGYNVRRKLSFVASAPDIEGISPELQEQSRLKLIRLRIRDKLKKIGCTLSFAERKKLQLSDKTYFYRNFEFRKAPSFEIDKPVRPLAQAVNSKPYLYSGESCSGHLNENPENPDDCMFYDTGYMAIYADEENEKARKLVEEVLPKLCKEESEADPDCKYVFEDNGDFTYALSWHWKNDEFQELLGQLYKPGIQNTPEEKAIQRKLWQLSPQARQKKITDKYQEFIEKVAALVESY